MSDQIKVGKFVETNGPDQVAWNVETSAVNSFPEGIGGNIIGVDAAGRVEVRLSHYQGDFNAEVFAVGVYAFLPESLIFHDHVADYPEGVVIPEAVQPEVPVAATEAVPVPNEAHDSTPQVVDVNVPPAAPAEKPKAASKAPAKGAAAKAPQAPTADKSNIPKAFAGVITSVSFEKVMHVAVKDPAKVSEIEIHYKKAGYVLAGSTEAKEGGLILTLSKPLG